MSSDDLLDELDSLLRDDAATGEAALTRSRSAGSQTGGDNRELARVKGFRDWWLLGWSAALFVSFFLPVIVLYEPESSDALGVVGSLGDTYFGATTLVPIGIVGLLVSLPVPIALWANTRRSGDRAAPGSSAVLYAALATFAMVALPTLLLGGFFSLLPTWLMPSLAAKVGFRVDLGPGAWAALVSSAALVAMAAESLSQERLSELRLGWLRRAHSADGRLLAGLAGLMVVSAGLRVIDWVKVDGTVDLIAPALGKLGAIHHSGSGGVPAALLPVVSGFQFGALAILGLSVALMWVRASVVPSLLAVLGAWGSFASAGAVAAVNASWGKELHLDIGPVSSIQKFKVDAVIESVQPSVWLTMITGLSAVALAIVSLGRQGQTKG